MKCFFTFLSQRRVIMRGQNLFGQAFAEEEDDEPSQARAAEPEEEEEEQEQQEEAEERPKKLAERWEGKDTCGTHILSRLV